MELSPLIARVLVKALDLWTTPVFSFGVRNGKPFVEFLPTDSPRGSIDERIAKIDAARHNLAEALEAIDELKATAEINKAEVASALERLDEAQNQKAAAEKELQAVRAIAQTDVEVFKKLAGVPSKTDIAKERLVGFLIGVTASIFASIIWWGLTRYWP